MRNNSQVATGDQWNWINILFFTFNTLGAVILVPLYIYNFGFSWGLMAFLFVAYMISNMSITCGYHRYFSHRSYDTHPFIEWLYIMLGAGAFQGSILTWCTDHRRHHRLVDTDEDPYSIRKGFWFAHMGWLLKIDQHPEARTYAKDLMAKPWVRFQHNFYIPVAAFMGFILPGLIGWALGFGFWGGFIFGGVLRIVISQHSTFFINSAAHMFGRQPYTDTNSARDSFIMAVLTFGEGYHNFHHYFQADYRNGVRWYQFDPTKWWIQLLAWLGLASRLKQAPKEEILKARLAMEERLLLAKGASAERVSQLRQKILEAQTRFRQLREEYQRTKKSLAQRGTEVRNHLGHQLQRCLSLKAEVQMAKIELRAAQNQWQVFRRSINRSLKKSTYVA